MGEQHHSVDNDHIEVVGVNDLDPRKYGVVFETVARNINGDPIQEIVDVTTEQIHVESVGMVEVSEATLFSGKMAEVLVVPIHLENSDAASSLCFEFVLQILHERGLAAARGANDTKKRCCHRNFPPVEKNSPFPRTIFQFLNEQIDRSIF